MPKVDNIMPTVENISMQASVGFIELKLKQMGFGLVEMLKN